MTRTAHVPWGMRYDLLISGGTVHSSAGGAAADVAVEGETIVAVAAPGVLRPSDARRVIDARGMDVCPGFIDVHVHLALPFCGTVSCDDYDAGSQAAANGGITMVIDFAIPGEGQSLRDAHDTWLKKARGISNVDFSWHMAITKRRHLDEVPAMVAMGLPTFKQFMIYEREGWNADDAMMFEALELMKRHDGMLLVHCESSRVLDLLIERAHTPENMRRLGARLHAMTRPNMVEVEAIERAVRWCESTGGRLYVVHMSTGEGAELIKAARARGVPVLAETCVQYLVLTDDVFDGPDGHLFACCPQVKKRADAERLWHGLGQEVCIVSTDTCSFTREQKGMWWDKEGGYGDWTRIPMGLPGLDTMVPLMYTKGVREGRISMGRLVELCSEAPARLMGMGGRKGRVAPGYDADLAIIDPSRTVRVTPGNRPGGTLRSRCDWSPFEGMELGGFAHTTIVRGTPIWEAYEPTTVRGHGMLIGRSKPGER